MSPTRTLPGPRSEGKTSAHVRLARAMTHELRNPLMVIGSMVRRIIRMNPEAAQGETYDALMSSIRRMELALKDLDSFISTPPPVLKLQRIDALIKAALEESAWKMRERSVRPVLSIFTPNIMAPVDAQLLEKTLSMIIDELISSLPGGSILPVALYDRDRDIEIMFGEADACEVFCDLYDARLESNVWSMSLALSSAHKILTDHGGTMLFRPDSGSAIPVLVRIPRRQSAE